ncbi:hypothetical protein [Leisingera caerulea]|uniref:hypothetical protein n=1 Tax=Leisingera caerulea TaxID=506591 RepID=UPI003F4A8670
MTQEILRAEAIDWWSSERGRIACELEERLPLLQSKVREIIEKMPATAYVWRDEFRNREIEPIAAAWIEAEYRKFTSEIDGSFSAAIDPEGSEDRHGWSGSEYAAVGAAAAFSVAPLAALPFVGGVIATSGFLFPVASLAAVPAAIVGAGAVALGYGPSVRGWAVGKLQEGFQENLQVELRLRVLGDAEQPEVPSLKGALFAELDGLLAKRLEELD